MRTAAELAAFYLAAQDAPRTGPAADLIRAYVLACEASWGILVRLAPYDIVFTAVDPYLGTYDMAAADQMAHEVAAHRTLRVYTGGSDGLRWTPEQNAHMRAVHDAMDHLDPTVPFTFEGEVWAYRRAVDRMGEAFAPILWSEIVLQAAAGVAATGGAVPQKIVLDPRYGR